MATNNNNEFPTEGFQAIEYGPTEQQITAGVQAANDWILENYPDGSVDYPRPEMVKVILISLLNR